MLAGCTARSQQRQPALSGRVVDASSGAGIGGARIEYSTKWGRENGTLKADRYGQFKQKPRGYFYFTLGFAEPVRARLFTARVTADGYEAGEFHFEWAPFMGGDAWLGVVALRPAEMP